MLKGQSTVCAFNDLDRQNASPHFMSSLRKPYGSLPFLKSGCERKVVFSLGHLTLCPRLRLRPKVHAGVLVAEGLKSGTFDEEKISRSLMTDFLQTVATCP